MFEENFFDNFEIDPGVKKAAEFFCYKLTELSFWKVKEAEVVSPTFVTLFMRFNDTPGDDANVEIRFEGENDSPSKFSVYIRRGEGIMDGDLISVSSLSWRRLKKIIIKFFI